MLDNNNLPIEFSISDKAQVVFVSDMFAEDYGGGAELTTEAIIEKSPYRVFKLHSHSLTEEMVKNNSDKYWVLVNWVGADPYAISELVRSKVRFSVIECDYKYCRYRSIHLHEIQENVKCNCENEYQGRFVSALYKKAEYVFFMSETQKEEYLRLFDQRLGSEDHLMTLISLFRSETLDYIQELRQWRENNHQEKHPPNFAILSGGSWIKNEQGCIEYAKKFQKSYELVGGLSHKDLLEKLAKEFDGLIFRPAGYDTCPRIVLEAKLLGLKYFDLNENVQCVNEPDQWWFDKYTESLEWFRGRPNYFWKHINIK